MLKITYINRFVPVILLWLGFFQPHASAQLSVMHDYQRVDSILVTGEKNDTLRFPFAGGLNSCQFVNIDIDLDGTDDLLVFDRHGNRILPFLVTPGSPSKLRYAPEKAALFPPLDQWVQAIDYNHDGKKDLFTYTTGGIKVYRNDSRNTLQFTQVTHPFLRSKQGSVLTNILVTGVDYPAIADLDGDGALDVLTFWGLGSFVEYHRNTSLDLYGTTDSLTFEKVSTCWGHFAEGNESNVITLDTCPGMKQVMAPMAPGTDDPKHTGSTLLLNDFNHDGLPDLALGDVDFSSIINLTNGGSIADARMVSQTTSFPNATDPVRLNSFPAAMLVDVDNDGHKDLVVSPFDPSLIKGENFKSVLLYHNSGTNLQPVYNLVSKSFLQDQMLDFGSGAYPVFFDYNGDGIMDVMVGNYGYCDSCILNPVYGLQCTYTAKLALLINTGTATNPQFRLADRNIAGLDSLQMQSLIPSVADMDGDGDLDMVLGNSKGKLVYCENVALPGQPADFRIKDPAWFSIDVGDFSAPQLFDLDNDGLTDLLIGKRDGRVSYYRNTGTKYIPQFTLVTDTLGGVDVTNTNLSYYGYMVPCFYKDKQGDVKLFAGSEFGDVYVYDHIKDNLDGKFRLLGTLPGIKEGLRSAVALGNLNNDTITDMLVGNYSGGLDLFMGKPDKIFGIGKANPHSTKLLVSPNPATEIVSVTSEGTLVEGQTDILLRTIDGKIIRKYSHMRLPAQLDVSGLHNGVYTLSIFTPNGWATTKLVICR